MMTFPCQACWGKQVLSSIICGQPLGFSLHRVVEKSRQSTLSFSSVIFMEYIYSGIRESIRPSQAIGKPEPPELSVCMSSMASYKSFQVMLRNSTNMYGLYQIQKKRLFSHPFGPFPSISVCPTGISHMLYDYDWLCNNTVIICIQ